MLIHHCGSFTSLRLHVALDEPIATAPNGSDFDRHIIVCSVEHLGVAEHVERDAREVRE